MRRPPSEAAGARSTGGRSEVSEGRRHRVLILISCGWAVRNYLRSGCVEELQTEADVHVMLPPGDADLEADLRTRDVQVHELRPARRPQGLAALSGFLVTATNFRHGFFDRALWNWTVALQPLRRRPYYAAHRRVARLVGASRFHDVLRRFERRRIDALRLGRGYEALLDLIQPDVVVSTDPYGFDELPVSLLALERGVPTVGAVVSWDNLSYKGHLVAPYTHFLVWGEAMKEDLLRHRPDLTPEQITVTGTPQFDFHVRPDLVQDRETFFRRLGADPSRPLITYSGAAVEWAFPAEADLVALLWDAIQRGQIPGRPQLLVRSHPIDRIGRFNHLEALCPGIIVQRPWPRNIDEYWWFTPGVDDLALLSNTLRHSDVNVNFPSSMTLDSAILGTPVVNVVFSLVEGDPRAQRIPHAHKSPHYGRIVACGATRIAHDMAELIEHVSEYLRAPEADQEGRRKAVEWICGPADGEAHQRVASSLLTLVELTEHPSDLTHTGIWRQPL